MKNAAGTPAAERSLRTGLLLAVLAVAAVLTRLPQLLSPHLVLDGDEAVLSLMARRAARLESFPLYFDGQKYGFSSLETGWAALHFALFGTSTLVLKAAMLGIWTAGAAFLCLAAGRLAGTRAAWIGAVLIVCCPGWGVWSLKARGGYLTAFLLTQACRWILARENGTPSARPAAFCLGLCASAALVAQPIFFLALVPWLALHAWRQRLFPRVWLHGFAGATVTLILIVVPGIFRSQGSWSPSLMNAPSLLAAVAELPQLLMRGFGGATYLRYAAGGAAFDVPALVWLAAAAVAALRAAIAPGAHACAQRATLAGALLVVAFAIPTLTPRYLVPVMDAVVFVLAIQAAGAGAARRLGGPGRRPANRASTAVVGLLAATGLAALLGYMSLVFSGDGVVPTVPSESAALDETLELLADRGVDGVYTLDPLLQWIVIDRSGEELPARWRLAAERTPIYIDRFAQAATSGGRLALLGYACQRSLIEHTDVDVTLTDVAGRYVLVLDPPRELLDALGFE